MRTVKLLATVCLMVLAATSADAGRQRDPAPLPLYVIEKAARPAAGEPLVLDAAEEFSIHTDPAVVAANPRAILIDLPGYPLLEARRTHFRVYTPDWKSWFGTLRYAGASGAGTGSIHLGFHGDRITGDISFEGERYRIVGGPEGGQWLVQLDDELSPPSCGVRSVDDWFDPLPFAGEEPTWNEPAKSAVPSFMAKSATVIDVLAVYPREFFNRNAAEETRVRDYVRDAIALANLAFQNSQIAAEYRLVGNVTDPRPVPLFDPQSQPSTGVLESLKWLTGGSPTNPNNPPRAPEAAALRDAFAADVVVLVVPQNWAGPNWCGTANEPQSNNRFIRGDTLISDAMDDRTFSALREGCGGLDYTLAHEIGHNFGLRHAAQDQNPAMDLYSQGRGYVFQVGGQTKATIHGCTCGNPPLPPCGDILGAVCNRIAHYSDPNVCYPDSQGVPTGTSGPDGRNEASVIRSQVTAFANKRMAVTNTPPTANFSFSCAGRTCTFDGGLSSDSQTNPLSVYLWDFGDGTTDVTSGRIAQHTYSSAPTGASFRIHLVVGDGNAQNRGQTGVTWRTVTIPPVYEGFHDIANCRQVFGWAWDQNLPNSPINVSIYRDSTLAAVVPANLYRADLVAAGKGNGVHGFNHGPLGFGWRDGQFHWVYVRFPSGSNLGTTPKRIICNARIMPHLTPTENNPTGGVVYTVGTQFSSSESGLITQLGFYRGEGETGTNTLRLWTDGGSLLASATANCSSAGWCWASINPVSIAANTRYRVSVNTNTFQVKTGCGIGGGIQTGPLTAHSGLWSAGNTFPTNGSCSNFFVDVAFDI